MLIRLASAVKRFHVSKLNGTRRRTVQDGSEGRPPRETKRLRKNVDSPNKPMGPPGFPNGMTTEAPKALLMRSEYSASVSLRALDFVVRLDAIVPAPHCDPDLPLPCLQSKVVQE